MARKKSMNGIANQAATMRGIIYRELRNPNTSEERKKTLENRLNKINETSERYIGNMNSRKLFVRQRERFNKVVEATGSLRKALDASGNVGDRKFSQHYYMSKTSSVQ